MSDQPRPTPRTAALHKTEPCYEVFMAKFEELEIESDAREERIRELERENSAFRNAAPNGLPELLLRLQQADELEAENAKLREALKRCSDLTGEPDDAWSLLAKIDTVACQALAGGYCAPGNMLEPAPLMDASNVLAINYTPEGSVIDIPPGAWALPDVIPPGVIFRGASDRPRTFIKQEAPKPCPWTNTFGPHADIPHAGGAGD